jgi:hypothetical protein
MSDSLVRVSRRVNKNHFVSITTAQYLTRAVPSCQAGRTLFSQAIGQAGPRSDAKARGECLSQVQGRTALNPKASERLSPPNLADADPPKSAGELPPKGKRNTLKGKTGF